MGTLIACLIVLALLVVAVSLYQRSLSRPGGWAGTGGFADAFGNLIDVFDPAQARADREKAHERHRGTVAPSPDDDLDRPVIIETNPDGTLRRARLRRVAPRLEDTEPEER